MVTSAPLMNLASEVVINCSTCFGGISDLRTFLFDCADEVDLLAIDTGHHNGDVCAVDELGERSGDQLFHLLRRHSHDRDIFQQGHGDLPVGPDYDGWNRSLWLFPDVNGKNVSGADLVVFRY